MTIRRLVRSRANRKIAGVCAGMADYLEVDVVVVRLAWVVLSIVPGAVIGGVVGYLAAWLVMPEGDAEVPMSGRRLTLSDTNRKVAGVCGGIADYFDVDATAVRLVWLVGSILFGACIGGVFAYLGAWMIMPRPPETFPAAASPATS